MTVVKTGENKKLILLARFINNEFVAGQEGKTFDVVNPSTEEVICSVSEATEKDVDIAVADGVLAHAVLPLAAVNTQGHTSPVGQGKLTGALPCYAVYTAACGGYLAVAALEKKFWDRFCQHIGRPDWQARHQPDTPAGCAQMRAELQAVIGAQPLAWWADHLAGVDCCVTPILKLEEALEHPQFQARGMVLQLADGQRQLACPVRMSGFEFALRQPAPQPGEHTDPVLAQAGYNADEIQALRAQRAVA